MSGLIFFRKSHNSGYTRKDGTYVAPFEDKRQKKLVTKDGYYQPVMAHPKPDAGSAKPSVGSAANYVQSVLGKPTAGKPVAGKPKPPGVAPQYGYGPKSPVQGDLFAGKKPSAAPKAPPPPPPKAWHPRANDDGKAVGIYHPHAPSSPVTWHVPNHIATVLPDGALPDELNGVPFAPWEHHPDTDAEWADVSGQAKDLKEPPFDPGEREPAAGVVIEEPDGRVWVVCPTNQHAGYHATYPKGHAEDGMSLQATAIKEAFEESGLQVEITGFVGDFPGGLTMTRYYRARRVGGTPAAMGWESQAVQLVPKGDLAKTVNAPRDKAIAAALTKG